VVGVEERAFKQQAIQLLVSRVRLLLHREYGITDTPIRAVPVDTDKVLRASVIESPARAGHFFASVRAPWWPIVAGEMTTFPKSGHDDTIDALSGAVQLAYKVLALLQMREAASHPVELQFTTGMPSPRKQGELERMLSWYR
jgi:phage terminase large subunit-like protein